MIDQPVQPSSQDPDVQLLVSRFGTSEGLRLPPADEWLADNVAIDSKLVPEHRRHNNALILDRAGDVEMPTHYVGYRRMRAGSPDATPPAHKVRATNSSTGAPRRVPRQLTFDLPAASRASASQASYDEWTDEHYRHCQADSRRKFWDTASAAAKERMTAQLAALPSDTPRVVQAREMGWIPRL